MVAGEMGFTVPSFVCDLRLSSFAACKFASEGV